MVVVGTCAVDWRGGAPLLEKKKTFLCLLVVVSFWVGGRGVVVWFSARGILVVGFVACAPPPLKRSMGLVCRVAARTQEKKRGGGEKKNARLVLVLLSALRLSVRSSLVCTSDASSEKKKFCLVRAP